MKKVKYFNVHENKLQDDYNMLKYMEQVAYIECEGYSLAIVRFIDDAKCIYDLYSQKNSVCEYIYSIAKPLKEVPRNMEDLKNDMLDMIDKINDAYNKMTNEEVDKINDKRKC